MTSISISQAHAAASDFTRNRKMVRTASIFFTPEHRRAAYAVYAFCRTADDLVDEEHVSLEQFRAWREQTRLPPEQQTDPILIAFADIRRQYNIDPSYEQAFLDGLELDLACHRYETLDELKKYCYGVATAPFLLAMSVVGFRPGVSLDQALPFIENMGIALQLTNIIRDVGEDLDVGRIYLPKSELARFGLTFADFEAKRCDDRFKNFMLYFTNLAKEYYTAGWPVLDLWTGSFRLAGGFGFILYRTILDEVEAGGFDVFSKRVKIPRLKMFWVLARKWPTICWPNSILQDVL